ncbi:hypothetical protein BDD12DRAFT_713332, partial [Trichophaea hybrida]
FTLKAYICLVTGDMLGRAKLQCFNGNRGTRYCAYCYAKAVHNGNTTYCPFTAPKDAPLFFQSPITDYDPLQLPLRNDQETRFISRKIVELNSTKLAIQHGINSESIFTQLQSIDMVRSFPPDEMHLWFENIFPDLVQHWRGKFHTAPDLWNIPPVIWDKMGRAMKDSVGTFPSHFGDAIRDFWEHSNHLKAAEWRTFSMVLLPIYLKDALPQEHYDVYMNLLASVRRCVGKSIRTNAIQQIRTQFLKFIQYYER